MNDGTLVARPAPGRNQLHNKRHRQLQNALLPHDANGQLAQSRQPAAEDQGNKPLSSRITSQKGSESPTQPSENPSDSVKPSDALSFKGRLGWKLAFEELVHKRHNRWIGIFPKAIIQTHAFRAQ